MHSPWLWHRSPVEKVYQTNSVSSNMQFLTDGSHANYQLWPRYIWQENLYQKEQSKEEAIDVKQHLIPEGETH